MSSEENEISDVALRVVTLCSQRGLTVATGESVTAGAVSAALGSVPGASAVLRGGIVAYHVDLKTSLLNVEPWALSEGIVSTAVAEAMAQGAAERCGSLVGVGTTGAAGPSEHAGAPVGSAAWAVWSPWQVRSEQRALMGERQAIQQHVVLQALILLERVAGEYSEPLVR